jgi:FMN-dependent NADH-azoreductase
VDETYIQAMRIMDSRKYNLALYEEIVKTFSQDQLVDMIRERNLALTEMPRKNKHCIDWFDKYNAKNEELIARFKN